MSVFMFFFHCILDFSFFYARFYFSFHNSFLVCSYTGKKARDHKIWVPYFKSTQFKKFVSYLNHPFVILVLLLHHQRQIIRKRQNVDCKAIFFLRWHEPISNSGRGISSLVVRPLKTSYWYVSYLGTFFASMLLFS